MCYLAREDSILLTCLILDGAGFNGAFQRAMQRDLDGANLREAQTAIMREAVAPLGIGERVVAVASVKPRIARRLTRPGAPEEGLKRAVYPLNHVLQDLTVDLAVLWQPGFDAGQLGLLLVVANKYTASLPGFAAPPMAAL